MKVISLVLNNFVNDSRVLKEAISLQKNGYKVEVIALHDDGLPEKEVQSGVFVTRVKLKTRKLAKIFIVQLFKYLEFALRVIVKNHKTDCIHVNDLGPLPIAIFIKFFLNRKVKIIYDAHEYETEKSNLRGFRKKAMKLLEKKLIKHCDSVITVSQTIAEEYKKLYNIPLPYVVLNCPPYRAVANSRIFREKFKIDSDKIIFMYQGALVKGRQIELILNTFSNIKNEKAVLVIMGNGALEGMAKRYAEENKNIYYQEAVPYNVVLEHTASADVGFAFLEDSCLNHSYALPNKFFEYLMSNILVVTNNLKELKGKVEEYNVGWVINELTEDELSFKINEIINSNNISEMYKNSETFARKYNWENQEVELLKAYK